MKRRKYNSHSDAEMTTKQYKTLRYLMVLWFRSAGRHKFRIAKNILLVVSLIGWSFYYTSNSATNEELAKVRQSKTANLISEIENIYNVNNFPSISREGKTMASTIKNLQNQHLKDRTIPDDKKYNSVGSIKKSWRLHCYAQLRKVIFAKTRLEGVERTILYLNYNKTDLIYDIYAQAGYDEVLSDLSNYYSRFLTEGQYKYILKGFE